MRKKVSFFIFNYSGSPVKQITASRSFLWFLSLFFISGAALTGYVLSDYYDAKTELLEIQVLEKRISDQFEEIKFQHKQVRKFADAINTLKSKLVDLNSFEKKIRVIAGIGEQADQKGLFGIGGSIPEDLSAHVDLTKKDSGLIREMNSQVDQLKQASDNQKVDFETVLGILKNQVNLLAHMPSIRPTRGYTTSRFGWRKSPFTGLREFHKGLDIATRFKTSIVATAAGKITFVGRKGLLGKVLIIDHGYGMVTRYGHLHKALKKRGEKVKRGDVIALVGKTGRVTGSHVHYEVLLNGIQINPAKHILN
ncbi:MAG: M23 family metallopeptidase [Desulfobacterales bacterium]